MKYWWIIQSLEAYDQHPDLIGCGLKEGTTNPIHRQFSRIRKGDHIVYYTTGDKVLIGIFEVVSKMEMLRDDPEWGDDAVYRIKLAIMPTSGFFLDWKKLLFEPSVSFNLFPNKKRARLIYTHLVNFHSDEYTSKVATNIKEARGLIETGFEYVTEMSGKKLFRKRK